jgi:hypothetical protein
MGISIIIKETFLKNRFDRSEWCHKGNSEGIVEMWEKNKGGTDFCSAFCKLKTEILEFQQNILTSFSSS